MKVAIVLLSDPGSGEGRGRMVNALMAAKEFISAGDEVRVVLDGAATRWPTELARPGHAYHGLYEAVRDHVVGACAYCAGRFQVAEENEAHGVALLDEFEGHPSFRRLVLDGYLVLTF